MGHDRLSVYGIAKDYGRPQLREVIRYLQARGLLMQSQGEYPTLAVAPMGWEFLRQRQSLSLPKPTDADDTRGFRPTRAGPASAARDYDEGLFEELRALRRRLADVQNVPPFVVFNDVSLRHMAKTFPRTMEEFSRIIGVGEVKLEQYGPEFLQVIGGYAQYRNLPNPKDVASVRQRPEEEKSDREREMQVRRRRTT